MLNLNRSIWQGGVPPDGPVAIGLIQLGIWFSLDTDGVVTGARWYQEAGSHGVIVATFWAADQTTLRGTTIARAALANIDDAYDGWRTAWLHPRIRLNANEPCLLMMTVDAHSVYRWDSVLQNGDIAPEGVRALAVGPDSLPGGRFDYPVGGLSNIPNNQTNNLYGIDVFADVEP